MNEIIAERSAMPIMIYELRADEFTPQTERQARDICLESALRELDKQGVYDVVLDSFPAYLCHHAEQDRTILSRLRATNEVDDSMWMHHAKMGEEHALWAADTVAWSVQRHYFGKREADSQHMAPLRSILREVHAETGAVSRPNLPSRPHLAGPAGRRERRMPTLELQQRVKALRASRTPGHVSGVLAPDAPERMRRPPQDQGTRGPSRSQ